MTLLRGAAKMKADIDRFTHDAEYAESDAALAREMGDTDASTQLNAKAADLRQRAADMSLALAAVDPVDERGTDGPRAPDRDRTHIDRTPLTALVAAWEAAAANEARWSMHIALAYRHCASQLAAVLADLARSSHRPETDE